MGGLNPRRTAASTKDRNASSCLEEKDPNRQRPDGDEKPEQKVRNNHSSERKRVKIHSFKGDKVKSYTAKHGKNYLSNRKIIFSEASATGT